ncbi:hypothetical protein KOW79_005137 [Hemibagrus wyckioides]|uniref:NTF2 domain-containing protein n=2 Tax=Hemibagrus wyckioides TaxID=337641 RepID=A0A9D3P1E6_9TELE|nr:hypothetical protein KOW79_005137 [Hemibagrus wyckioides]
MAVMSKKESDGCRKLLKLLSEDDLLALNDTVTNRLITAASSSEAIEAIIAYSQSAEELLKRKKVHRDVIFKYLAAEKVHLNPNSDKHHLVKTTLELWTSVSENTVKVSKTGSIEQNRDGLGQLEALGKQFCQWFFQLLNSQSPQAAQQCGTIQDWGPQHFWSDARMLLLSQAQVQQKDEFLGAELVSQRLLALVWEEGLLFCPNLEQTGLKCVSSPHGLVVVAVAGTIHRENDCLGVFEQVFGLIRAPQDDNRWKIKAVHLKVKGHIVKGTLPAVTYDSEELLQLFTK